MSATQTPRLQEEVKQRAVKRAYDQIGAFEDHWRCLKDQSMDGSMAAMRGLKYQMLRDEHLLVGGDWNMNFVFLYIGNNHPN